jgi:PIN domain nuclease of toxin-antitoxin system
MRLLLDTHAFLWINLEPEKCSEPVLRLCRQPETDLLLSMVSVGEIQIKHQLGKLPLAVSLCQLLETNQADYGLQLLPIQPDQVYALVTVHALTQSHRTGPGFPRFSKRRSALRDQKVCKKP